MAHLDSGDSPMAGVHLTLSRLGKKSQPIKTLSDANGNFSFPSVRTGRYRLTSHYESLRDFSIDLAIQNERSLAKQDLLIWLGADFRKPCSDSYAEVIFRPTNIGVK